ncbi:MAG: phosphopentomutase, partial [Bacilli bacterium]|nr:phosphopentomutase [Bacilli bacterium]
GYMCSAVGKINDIFNGQGVSKTIHTASNEEGMDETIRQLKEEDWTGLCFVNLVEFDSEYGHRRDPEGYARCLEAFDKRVGEFVQAMKEDDLLMITADHGNDPTFHGTDHTREKVPLLLYSPSIRGGKRLEEAETFGVIGASILENFHLKKTATLLGEALHEIYE